MRVICVTGPIASGKTTVVHLLHSLYRVPIIKMDFVGHYVLRKPHVINQVVSLLGEEVLVGGHLSRPLIAKKVFSDRHLLTEYSRIVHDAMTEYAKFLLDHFEHLQFDTAVLEAAILYEGGWHTLCGEVWAVLAPPKTIYRRLGREKFFQFYKPRRKYQMSDNEYRKRADFVICNAETQESLKEQISFLWTRFESEHM